jgi:hypothetical protein
MDPTEEDEQAFFAALGKAITRWADLEAVLFEITATILDCTRERAAIVFYRTPTIDSRLTLTSDLVHSFFPRHEPGEQPDPRIKRWKDLQAEIKENLPIRNHLAHHPVGPVVDIYETPDGKGPKFEVKPASYRSASEHLRKRERSPDILGINEVEAHTAIVSRIVTDLRNFRRQKVPSQPSEPSP